MRVWVYGYVRVTGIDGSINECMGLNDIVKPSGTRESKQIAHS